MSEQPIIRSQWARRAQFAEEAEAVGVPTDQIIGSMTTPEGVVTVMFTKTGDVEDDTPFYGAVLTRDADGVLALVKEPEQAGTWADLASFITEGESDEGTAAD